VIPPAPELDGYTHTYSGKVRDLYRSDADASLLLIVASDRVSAYDHVLQPSIPDKGRILTSLTLWWLEQLDDIVGNHVVAAEGAAIPEPVRGRALLCRRLSMVPVECVARGYLTGSGLADYRRTGSVCGVQLPDGLQEASRLREPIFTPATKAALGEHDENIDYDAVVRLVGERQAARLRELTLAVYERAEGVARTRGILLADTKLEFGTDAAGRLVLADEVLTPDSSRFWPAEGYQPGRTQPSFDKQVVRDWLTSPASGWNRDAGSAPPDLPADVVALTRDRYAQAYERLTGRAWRP
jgi:phosphoribosylaminoimidazole-succinocarboxamide synthase